MLSLLVVTAFSRCGDSSLGDYNFIAGATNKAEGNEVGHWPWMASIGFFDSKGNWQHICGASLISDRHFLSAAHCFLQEPW